MLYNVSLSTTELSTDANLYNCSSDISPDSANQCIDYYRWYLCEADWMKGWCCGTCGYSSCIDVCYDNDINNIPTEYYPNPFDCESDLSPPPDHHDCSLHKEWDNCGSSWMFGWCCNSCPQDCACTNNTKNTVPLQPIVTTYYNYTNSENNCNKDIPPPPGPDGLIPQCIDQYRWGNCGADWMSSYCCLTCGYTSCLDTCWDNDVNNIPAEYYPNPFDCESNRFLENDDDSCFQEAGWGNCDESWMFGLCCVSCPEACGCQDYDWGNRTEHLNSRPAIILSLTYEEVLFYERLFISCHAILLFLITVIPLLFCYKYHISRITENVLTKMASMVSTNNVHNDEGDPESVNSSSDYIIYII